MNKPFEKVERGRNRIDEELRLWNESRSTRAAEHDEEGLIEKMMEILSYVCTEYKTRMIGANEQADDTPHFTG
jgi:hypothetical protein